MSRRVAKDLHKDDGTELEDRADICSCRRLLGGCNSNNNIIIGWKYGGARQLFGKENAIGHVTSD